MLIPPKYFLTPKITKLLQSIEGSRQVIDTAILPKEVEVNIRRRSTLRSSLFSARIEGNTLTLDELPQASSSDQKKREVLNILKGFNFLMARGSKKDITIKDILALQKTVMEGLIPKLDLGKFRTNLEAIFNSSGIAIYIPPKPAQISSSTRKMLKFTNSSKEQFVPIRAALTHYTFEKIHPFLDGNGRVGRLLLQAVLEKGGYGMRGLINLEEYLDNHRSLYYQALDSSERDVTEYLEYILEAIDFAAAEAKTEILKKDQLQAQDYLLPRRAEILNIIRDHNLINFNTIQRRFMAINGRTLRYDLKQLQDAGLIKKLGSTKGVYYQII
ncbi:MAG: Fic family protein [Candidatus Daviesbacteria bacterium]|nr:Fic family protein [Candidatus Daviesbacteria bacterium]